MSEPTPTAASEPPFHEPPAPNSPAVAVVVPVHNEVENVEPLIAEIVAALSGRYRFEMVFVDDGSQDGTADRLADLARRHAELRTVRHTVCAGQSAALATGIRAASAPLIATLDGDGQNDPADIPPLMEAHGAAPEPARLMLAGLRAKRKDTWIKRFSSRIANGIRSRILGDRTPDTGCGLKVFPRAAFLAMPPFDHMHRFLPALMLRAGGEVVSHPVNHRPRVRGTSKYGTLDRLMVGLFDLVGVVWLNRRARIARVDILEPGSGRSLHPGGGPEP